MRWWNPISVFCLLFLLSLPQVFNRKSCVTEAQHKKVIEKSRTVSVQRFCSSLKVFDERLPAYIRPAFRRCFSTSLAPLLPPLLKNAPGPRPRARHSSIHSVGPKNRRLVFSFPLSLLRSYVSTHVSLRRLVKKPLSCSLCQSVGLSRTGASANQPHRVQF